MTQLRISDSVDGEQVAPQLRPLLERVHAEVARRPAQVQLLWKSLYQLLVFLASPEGRTHANCCAANWFFLARDGWDTDWDHLSPQFSNVFEGMADCLHDTIAAPDIAHEFRSTPEQLLAELCAIPQPER